MKLTEPQIRHLTEVAAIGRQAGWYPRNSGERQCAENLLRKGLMQRADYSSSSAFVLTEVGWARAQNELAAGYDAARL